MAFKRLVEEELGTELCADMCGLRLGSEEMLSRRSWAFVASAAWRSREAVDHDDDDDDEKMEPRPLPPPPVLLVLMSVPRVASQYQQVHWL